MPGPGRAFFCQPLVVCTPQALLLYELSVYTMQFAGRQLPALRSIPMCHIRSKITLPHTFTSSSTTSGKPQPAPQPSPGHIPIFPILHIRHDNGLPHTILSSSDRTGKPQPAPQPSPGHIPPFPHPTHQEITKLPYTALYATFSFSPSYTSGAKSPFLTLLPPHL